MKAIAVAKNADQVELGAFRDGYAIVGDGLADEEISGELEELADNDSGALEEWAAQDVYRDTEEGSIKKELELRSELLGRLYPFEMRGALLSYRNSDHEIRI